LRRKDWSDLHQLWWVLLREKNCLLTRSVEVIRYDSYIPAVDHRKDLSDRFNKVRKSLYNIKAVIGERSSAWEKAMSIWEKKLQGEDIDDPEFIRRLETIENDEKLISKIRHHGRYTPHRGLKYLEKVEIMKEDAKQAYLISNKRRATKLRQVETEELLDMLPVHDRRHLSRKRVAKIRINRGK
jgi:hypothetical protein